MLFILFSQKQCTIIIQLLSFIYVYPLNFNKFGRIKSIHQVFILKNISHLGVDYMGTANHEVSVGMRMLINPSIDSTVGNQISIFAGKGTVQHKPYAEE